MSSEIKLAEITRVVANSPNKKAAGPDGITNEVLKSSFGLVFSFLVTLFNICFTNATCPVVWLDAYLKPLYKGKGEKTDPNSYRGISLLSCVYKCYSAILYNRLSNWVELQKLLPDTQYGFRKGRSTILAAKKLIESTRRGIRSKKRYYVCYVDFEKAFDKLDRQLLFTKLQRNGVPVHFTKVLYNLYVQNNIQVCSDGYLSTKISQTIGVPQGDKLSPLLFALFLTDLSAELESTGCFTSFYANDLAIGSTEVDSV